MEVPVATGSILVFNTGIIARLRLWRTLRAAKIFFARGQVAEARRAWSRALEIYPGALEAKFGLALAENEERFRSLSSTLEEVSASQQSLQTLMCGSADPRLPGGEGGGRALQSGPGGSQVGASFDALQSLEARVEAAETEAFIARADWQTARRQVVTRMNWLEHQLTIASSRMDASTGEITARLTRLQEKIDASNLQQASLLEEVSELASHFRSAKALSHVVAQHGDRLRRAVEVLGLEDNDADANDVSERVAALRKAMDSLERQFRAEALKRTASDPAPVRG